MTRSPALRAHVVVSLLCLGSHARFAMAATAAPDSLAGHVVQCVDFRTGDPLEVHAQHLTPLGVIDIAWDPDHGRLCAGTASEVASVRVPDGSGGAIVAWVDTRVEEGDIYAQHLGAGGGVASGWPAAGLAICTAPGSQYQLSMTPDGAGGAVIAWLDFRAEFHAEIRAQRVSRDGALMWEPDGVQVAPDSVDQLSPTVLGDAVHGALVVWSTRRADHTELRVMRLDATGNRIASLPSTGLTVASDSMQASSERLLARPGGAWLCWQSEAATGSRIRAIPLGPESDAEPSWPVGGRSLSASGAAASFSDAVTDTAGGLIAVWSQAAEGVHSLRAQRITEDGALPWGADGVPLCEDPHEQIAAAVVADGGGGILVAWEDYRSSSEADIWAQRASFAGTRLWGASGRAVCMAAGHQFAPSVANDGDGGALITWIDGVQSARASYMRSRPVGIGSVPRLIQARAAPRRAEIAWRTEAGDSRVLTVLRKDPQTDWRSVAERRPDPTGMIAYEDRGLPVGVSISYRLAYLASGDPTYYDQVTLQIPSPKPLALHSANVEQNGRALHVVVTLETDGPASLEVFDVQGRRIEGRQLETEGSGDYELAVPLDRKPMAGIYFVRLKQDRAVRTTRMLVIR